MIISGGVNIYPQEIEDLLISHEAVLDAAVFGVPDADFGEAVKAVVECNPSHKSQAPDALAQSLIAFCRANLSHIKCPKSIEFIESLPRHPTGKLYKAKLRAPYWQDHPSQII
jgi:long-chain acyl-CoA synthetase